MGTTKLKDYQAIADSFEKALGDIVPPSAFRNAITAMKLHPDLCNRISCWDETIWLIIQEFLNSGGQVREEDYFLHACALLEG
jgi:hypothetical protein